jgi:hypothetical protein
VLCVGWCKSLIFNEKNSEFWIFFVHFFCFFCFFFKNRWDVGFNVPRFQLFSKFLKFQLSAVCSTQEFCGAQMLHRNRFLSFGASSLPSAAPTYRPRGSLGLSYPPCTNSKMQSTSGSVVLKQTYSTYCMVYGMNSGFIEKNKLYRELLTRKTEKSQEHFLFLEPSFCG